MIERVERQFNLTPKRLVADTAYGAAPTLNWIVNEKKIEPHIPLWEKSLREDGTFSRPDFHFDAGTNTYEGPGGKKLTSTGRPTNAGTVLFRASQRKQRKKVEMLFAHLKRILKLDRLRLRGISGARTSS
jgi:hypothetical protein